MPGTNNHTVHDYANLYICARNPMLFKRKSSHAELCVLQISTTILDIDGAIVTDRNAAANIVSFRPALKGLQFIDREKVFAEDWRHPDDELEYRRHKSIKCAEVLVPNRISPEYITGAYASCTSSKENLLRVAPDLNIIINPYLFFQEIRS